MTCIYCNAPIKAHPEKYATAMSQRKEWMNWKPEPHQDSRTTPHPIKQASKEAVKAVFDVLTCGNCMELGLAKQPAAEPKKKLPKQTVRKK